MDFAVEIESTSEDPVGQNFIYKIKEGINKSSSMHVTYENEDRFCLSIITLDADKENYGLKTVYSVTYLFKSSTIPFPYYLNSSVGYCGANRVQQCADGIVADTFSQIEEMIRLFQATQRE